jgi:hypothetical protein
MNASAWMMSRVRTRAITFFLQQARDVAKPLAK